MMDLVGVLPIDKPEGPTSHDIVATARRALRIRRIGHTGTLDPFASGLLLLCLGPATRLAEYLTGLPKRYTATIRLGQSTDTDDRTGGIVAESDGWRTLSEDQLRAAVSAQSGEIEQLPPMYSAKKVAGERLYRAARRGEEVERAPVRVTVHEITITRVALPEVEIEVECSSGTYIRAIARDIGAALGVGGHLTALRRTRIGPHDIGRAITVDQLESAEPVAGALITPADAVAYMPRVVLGSEDAARVRNGNAVNAPDDVTDNVTADQTADLTNDLTDDVTDDLPLGAVPPSGPPATRPTSQATRPPNDPVPDRANRPSNDPATDRFSPGAGDRAKYIALLDGDGALLAIAERKGALLQPRKVFA